MFQHARNSKLSKQPTYFYRTQILHTYTRLAILMLTEALQNNRSKFMILPNTTGCPRSKRTILNSYCGQAIDFKEPKNEICAWNKRTFCFLREFEKLKKFLKSVILAYFDVGGIMIE